MIGACKEVNYIFCTASFGYREPQERARGEVEEPRNRKKTALEARESGSEILACQSSKYLVYMFIIIVFGPLMAQTKGPVERKCSSRLVEPLHVQGSCQHLYVLFPGGQT